MAKVRVNNVKIKADVKAKADAKADIKNKIDIKTDINNTNKNIDIKSVASEADFQVKLDNFKAHKDKVMADVVKTPQTSRRMELISRELGAEVNDLFNTAFNTKEDGVLKLHKIRSDDFADTLEDLTPKQKALASVISDTHKASLKMDADLQLETKNYPVYNQLNSIIKKDRFYAFPKMNNDTVSNMRLGKNDVSPSDKYMGDVFARRSKNVIKLDDVDLVLDPGELFAAYNASILGMADVQYKEAMEIAENLQDVMSVENKAKAPNADEIFNDTRFKENIKAQAENTDTFSRLRQMSDLNKIKRANKAQRTDPADPATERQYKEDSDYQGFDYAEQNNDIGAKVNLDQTTARYNGSRVVSPTHTLRFRGKMTEVIGPISNRTTNLYEAGQRQYASAGTNARFIAKSILSSKNVIKDGQWNVQFIAQRFMDMTEPNGIYGAGLRGIEVSKGSLKGSAETTATRLVEEISKLPVGDINTDVAGRLAYLVETYARSFILRMARRSLMNIGYKNKFTTRAARNAYNDSLNAIDSVDIDKRATVMDIYTRIAHASAMGGVTRGTVQNLWEPFAAVLQFNGMRMRDIFNMLKTGEAKRLLDQYGEGFGLSADIYDFASNSAIANSIEKITDFSTLPFNYTQKLSVISYIAIADRQATRLGLNEMDKLNYVRERAAAMSIGRDALSMLGMQRGRGRYFTMYWTWPLRNIERLQTAWREASGVQGKAKVATGALGGAGIQVLLGGLFGAGVSDSLGANPFGVFDQWEHLSDHDKMLVDRIIELLPLPYVLSPFGEVYWQVRTTMEGDRNDVEYDPTTGEGYKDINLWEAAAKPQLWANMLTNVLTSHVPMSVMWNHLIGTYEMYNLGYKVSQKGFPQYEAPENGDVVNLIISLIAGPGATWKGSQYSGRSNYIGAVLNGGSWGNVISSLKQQWHMGSNDQVVQTLEKLLDSGVKALGGDGVAFTDLGKLRKQWEDTLKSDVKGWYETAEPWRALTGYEVGKNFTGGLLDRTVFNQEVSKLTKIHDDIMPEIEELNKIIGSTNDYYTDAEKQQAKDNLKDLAKDYEDYVHDLVLAYVSKGNKYTSGQRQKILGLLDYNREAPENEFNEQVLNYRRVVQDNGRVIDTDDVGTVNSIEDTARNTEFYGKATEFVNGLRQALGKGDLKQAKNEMQDKINAIYDHAEKEGRYPTSSEYDKINSLKEDYMREFDKAFKRYAKDRGGVQMVGYADVADALKQYVAFPDDDWKKSERGYYLSTRQYPFATADVQELLMQRYNVKEQYLNRQTSSKAEGEIQQIYNYNRLGGADNRAKARAKAKQLLSKAMRGEVSVSDEDKAWLQKAASSK